MKRNFVLAGIASIASATPAAAQIVTTAPSAMQGQNILLGGQTQTGTTIIGSTQSGASVSFGGTTVGGGTVLRSQGGQARIEGALNLATRAPNDTLLLRSLTFALPGGGTFNNLEFALFGGTARSVSFSLTDNLGQLFAFTGALGNGANRFGFTGLGNASIQSVAMTFGEGGVQDMRQVRLDEVLSSGVPEPATWAFMIVGFGAVGAAMRRKRGAVALIA